MKTNGDFEFYYNKEMKLHREDDLPTANLKAINGKFWYKEGKLHRGNDLPAIENPEMKCWYKNGKQHRIGKPSTIGKKVEMWFQEGKIHREDGYALIRNITNSKKIKKYFINDEKLTEEEFEKAIKIKSF